MVINEEKPAVTVVRSQADRARARRRRQSLTFLVLFALFCGVGVAAWGNWKGWWTIGSRNPRVAVACPVQKFVDPGLTRINVANGTERAGLAAAVTKELQKRRFRVVGFGTAERGKAIPYVVTITFGPSGRVSARTVARQFPGRVNVVNDKRETDQVDILIGDRYKGMVPRAKGAAAIKLTPDPEGCVDPPTR